MTKGAFTVTATDSVILAADMYRGQVALQLISGGPMWIGFGEAAVDGEGIAISESAGYIQITDHRAILAIHGKTAAGAPAVTGGYQTA